MSGVKAREGEEVWVNTLGGRLWYTITDSKGKERTVHARPGQQFRISTDDRELNSANHSGPESDPFLNGIAKRVDERAEEELPEEYDAEQALTDQDLLLLLAKNGMAFQSAVKKLDERNARRLRALTEAEDTTASVPQQRFVEEWVAENFRHGGQTSTGKELLADPS